MMSIRWDSLLVRHLARELHRRLGEQRLRAVRLDGSARDLVLLFRDCSLVWRLHPARSTVLLRPATEPARGDHRIKARVRRIDAPVDERILRFELVAERSGASGFEVVIELIGNRLNAVVTQGRTRTIRHALVRREEASREISAGRDYVPPEPTGRAGLDGDLTLEQWLDVLADVPPPERPRELVRNVAWTSSLNAAALLDPTLEDGYAVWTRLVRDSVAREPSVLTTERGLQPYPFALAGYDATPADGLVEAFERCTEADEATGRVGPALAVPPELMERLDDAIAHAQRRITRMQAELDNRADPEALRAVGDLILARFSELPPGAEKATLIGFDGEPVAVALDPELPPQGNAASYYDRAGRSERAAERIPGLMARVEKRLGRLEALRKKALEGDVDADDVRAALPPSRRTRGADDDGPSLPYRTFRSSGGLEIRVGRGARHNDDLTFHHSAPDDVWLHARHSAGAHVILRWPDDGNPPARDLAQAAVLAALHSKARTSTSVPVDWTRRKYVRKPSGSAPGAVVPDRVETLFVRPDEEMLERLAED